MYNLFYASPTLLYRHSLLQRPRLGPAPPKMTQVCQQIDINLAVWSLPVLRQTYKPALPPPIIFHHSQSIIRPLKHLSSDVQTIQTTDMSTSGDQPSTIQSYVDSASSAVQSAFGSLTGSTSDKVCRLDHLNVTATDHSIGCCRQQEG